MRLWLGPFVAGLGLVLGILLLGRALKLMGNLSDSVQAWGLIVDLLLLTMPYFLLLTVPMAFFLSMQNTIVSLQQSSEMDALRASGVSYKRMFRSLFLVAVLLWGGLSYTSMVWLPQGQLGFNNLLLKVYALKGSIAFSPQRFSQSFGDITVYVDGEDDQGEYHGVILDDHRGGLSVVYTSESARFVPGGKNLGLVMKNGVRMEGKGKDLRTLAFESYKVNIPLPSARFKQQHADDHVILMPPAMLWAKVKNDGDSLAAAEWNRRLLLPTSVLVLCFFALSLSLSQKRSGKAGSMIVGIALLVALFNVQLFLHRQTSQGIFPAWSMWAGQGGMLAMGIFLWVRAEQDRMPRMITHASEWFYLIHQAVMGHLSRRWGKGN